MADRLSQHFVFSTPIEFVDVPTDTDVRVFIDPSGVRNDRSPLGVKATNRLVAYFTEVLGCRFSPIRADRARGREMLDGLHEPNQTRLGYSIAKLNGSAFGPEHAQALWDELGVNPVAQAAVLTHLEDLPIYMTGVGLDLMSDLVTRVIFSELIEFTEAQMLIHPDLSRNSVQRDLPVYDAVRSTWGQQSTVLPFAGPLEVLLVPLKWVHYNMRMNQDAFYNRVATTLVQEELTNVFADGTRIRPSKERIKFDNPGVRQLNADKSVEYNSLHSRVLPREFSRYIDSNFVAMTADDVDRYRH
jgi:hypothetical protein